MNKIITLIIVLIIFFYLSYKKYQKEHFNFKEELKIFFDKNKTILWSNDEKLDNVNYSLDTITFNRTNDIYYSNEIIFNEFSNFNGLILKPLNEISDFTIGFMNIEINKEESESKNTESEDNKSKNNDNLQFGIKFLGDNYIQIIENNEIINLDYCFDKNITNCEKTNDKYKYKENDILGMNIINSRMNFFIIKNKDNDFKGIRIHRSQIIVDFPLKAVVINKVKKNKIQNNVWTSSLLIPPPSPWSVEYSSLNKYNQKEMPKQIDLDREVVIEAPAPVVEEREIDPFMKVIIINEARLIGNKNLKIKSEVNNINQNYINKLFEISIRLKLKENRDNISLLIPVNQSIIVNRNNKLSDIEIDLAEYVNYFYRKEFTAEIMFRRSRSLGEQFSIISNKFTVLRD